TGYHETTRLLLRMMPDFVKPGDRVLDAGTGTGVLAIAAVKLGAVSATAFDIDPWSQENAVENFYLNRVQDQVKMIHGGIEKLPSGTFDVILANINLNVILGLLPEFADRLKADGTLLLSGVLQPDRDRLLVAAQRSGLDMITEANENEWWAGAFMRIQDLREGIRTRPVEFVESRRRHPVVDCLAQVEVASPVASHERAKGGAVWNNRRHPLSYSAMKSGAQPRVSPPSFARPGWQFQEIRCSMRWPASLSRKAVKTSYG
ncbi:MAG: 50S ribosomal protein L11 methyltransferase, partial [Rhodothermales bacterium]